MFLLDTYGNYISYMRWVLWTCTVIAWLHCGWICGVKIAGNKVKVNIKFTLEQAMKAQRGSRGIALLFFLTSAQDGVGGQHNVPAALHLRKLTWYPLYRRLGGPQSWSGKVKKISPSPGFDPRTIQPIDSCYTD
jgi:hypothetical protein